jgi:hypothetical protein
MAHVDVWVSHPDLSAQNLCIGYDGFYPPCLHHTCMSRQLLAAPVAQVDRAVDS